MRTVRIAVLIFWPFKTVAAILTSHRVIMIKNCMSYVRYFRTTVPCKIAAISQRANNFFQEKRKYPRLFWTRSLNSVL